MKTTLIDQIGPPRSSEHRPVRRRGARAGARRHRGPRVARGRIVVVAGARTDPTVPGLVAPAAVTHHVPVAAAQPTTDPTALADGVYPTFVRAVDVPGATITVDVLQTFVGSDAHQAAIQDGVSWNDVRYDPVYIRNENPLLRTLPVALTSTSSSSVSARLRAARSGSRSCATRRPRSPTPSTTTSRSSKAASGASSSGSPSRVVEDRGEHDANRQWSTDTRTAMGGEGERGPRPRPRPRLPACPPRREHHQPARGAPSSSTGPAT